MREQLISRDASESLSSLQIARRLLDREAATAGAREPGMVGAALQGTCLRVLQNLRDSMGDEGSTALFARALARTQADHPALMNIRRISDGNVHLDGVVASVDVHGVEAVTAALEALLAALIDILARLIGEDMALRLVDHDVPRSRTDIGAEAT